MNGEISTQRKIGSAVAAVVFAGLVYYGVWWRSQPPPPPAEGKALLLKIESGK